MSKCTVFVAMLLPTMLLGTPSLAQRPDSALLGEWSGTAQISVDWSLQRELAVRVTIGADGAVTGRVGDATLANGRIRTNRSRIMRAMGYGTDWVIEGRLVGSIVHREAIQRETVRIPLNWTGSTLEGELATSGSYEDMRDDMILTAKGLVLRRVGGTPTPASR